MNYEIDQLKLSEQIITVAKKASVVAGLYILLTFIILFVFYFFGMMFLFDFPKDLTKFTNPTFVEDLLAANPIQLLILNGCLSIIGHFLLSGIYGMLHNSNNVPYISLGSAYKAIFSIKGLKVLNIIIVVQAITTTLSYFLESVGFSLVGFGIGILVQFLTYFTYAAIYEHNLSLGKSVSLSIAIFNYKPGFLFLLIAIAYFISLSGIIFFGIGIILTLPLNYIVAYCLYLHITEQLTD